MAFENMQFYICRLFSYSFSSSSSFFSLSVIAMAPTLYYFVMSPYSRSVLLTVRALGLDVELKTIDLTKKEQLEPGFVAINPQHTVPTLVDGDLLLTER